LKLLLKNCPDIHITVYVNIDSWLGILCCEDSNFLIRVGKMSTAVREWDFILLSLRTPVIAHIQSRQATQIVIKQREQTRIYQCYNFQPTRDSISSFYDHTQAYIRHKYQGRAADRLCDVQGACENWKRHNSACNHEVVGKQRCLGTATTAASIRARTDLNVWVCRLGMPCMRGAYNPTANPVR